MPDASVRSEKDEPIRLLHILYGGMGGIGAYFMEFVTSDVRKRFEHQAVFYGIEPVFPDYRDFCVERGIPYCEVVKRRGPDLIALVRLFKALLVRTDAVIIHTSSAAPPALARRWISRTPLLHVEHSPVAAKTKQERFWCRLLRRWSDRTVLFYPSHRDELDGPRGGLSDSQCLLIPKMPDMAFFQPGKRPRDASPLRIGMQGRLSVFKDHGTLIRAMAILKRELDRPVSLELAGDGDERPALESLAAELGVSDLVTFHGRLSRGDLLAFLQGLDIYVHATCGETHCYAIMEAQACGLPIVASDVRGVREGLDQGSTGLLFPHRDPEALASLLTALIQDPAERLRLGRNSREQMRALAAQCQTAESYHAAMEGLRSS